MQSKEQAKYVLEHLDELFPIVRASELKMDDAFMRHTPIGWVQERVMNTLTTQIPKGIQDFRHPSVDPSFDDEGNLVYQKGRKPGVDKVSILEWKVLFKGYLPEKHSRMESDIGYDIFCGVLIKELVARGLSVERSWYEVCHESCKLGHFWDSHDPKNDFENTGSRPQGVWSDLGNTRKIVANEQSGKSFTVSGSYKDSSQMFSIASIEAVHYQDYIAKISVGLMRMDV